MDYSVFVREVADGDWPSQTIFNRSPDHAAVIVENLFRKAESRVEILTNTLSEEVYNRPEVKKAAVSFLRRHPRAHIDILAEELVVRAAHPFLIHVDASGLGNRLTLARVRASDVANYKFNFAVADGKSFRFEESRLLFNAIVGFGHEIEAARLHHVFQQLKAVSA